MDSPTNIDSDDRDQISMLENGERSLSSKNLHSDQNLKKLNKSSNIIKELIFYNIGYSIDSPDVKKNKNWFDFTRKNNIDEHLKFKILENVSGSVKTAEMLALMGPSGSGKTSLLNVLAQRVPSNKVTGSILADGHPLKKSFKRHIGFVFQDDLMLWNLTVRETMLFAAKLRLPQKIPEHEKERKVDCLIEKLGLTNVAHRIIGRENRRGVSGGERKRTSIGVEIISEPLILFLDEPTSGLDSSTALSIVSLLRVLAKEGMIVVCSIHQPRSNIFSQFDKVMLLKKGRTAYYGKQSKIVSYFENMGHKLSQFSNPADWILDLSTKEKTGANSSKNFVSLTDYFQQKVNAMTELEKEKNGIPTEKSILASQAMQSKIEFKTGWKTSFLYQFKVLMERQSKQSRGEVFTGANIFQIMAVAIIASALWWQSDNVSDITGVFFFISIQQSFNAMSLVMRVFPSERGLMVRERSAGSYRVGPYFLSKSFSDIYLYIVFPSIYGIMVYFSAGLNGDAEAVFIFLGLFLMQILTAQSLGMLISAWIKDLALAQSFSFVLVLLIMLFGGFYVNNDNIPYGLNWIKYLSFLYWGYGALIVNEFEGREYPCVQDTANTYGNECPIPGDNVIKSLKFEDIEIWQSFLMLIALFSIYRFATYLVLRYTTKMRL
mmetsp:Transcript_10082/g.15181  ORF Transcript_10082/g.15181 Transcript_10082/m.15181 type:complete len:661 (+) Transcript_10082:84-2066(+)